MNYYKNGNQIIATVGTLNLPKITADEYQAKFEVTDRRIQAQSRIEEARRPLTESEVSRLLIAKQINTLTVDDQTALRMVEFYPSWASDTAYPAVYKVQYGGKLWRCLQAHTSQSGWEPENVPALWEELCETHDGSLYDPIPYEGSMALVSGKYYSQDGVTYLCSRDTVNPVYNPLRELVGIYVEQKGE